MHLQDIFRILLLVVGFPLATLLLWIPNEVGGLLGPAWLSTDASKEVTTFSLRFFTIPIFLYMGCMLRWLSQPLLSTLTTLAAPVVGILVPVINSGTDQQVISMPWQIGLASFFAIHAVVVVFIDLLYGKVVFKETAPVSPAEVVAEFRGQQPSPRRRNKESAQDLGFNGNSA